MGLGYTYLDTEQLTDVNIGNELRNAPRHHVSADAVYRTGLWTASATALFASSSFSDAANTVDEDSMGSVGELPSYTLVNTRLGRDIPLDNDMTLNVGMGVNNLLDDDAYFRGADVSPVGRVPMPGRTYVLEGELSF
ncbi:TonB-dependent receptor domain-containing protein [Zobellella taiwanensis]|uniref:TonB-dependent receptor domain-containing protein n=1 Tax=Zobellella taiwanensis TaxID=347535 RepID=UPI003183CB2E